MKIWNGDQQGIPINGPDWKNPFQCVPSPWNWENRAKLLSDNDKESAGVKQWLSTTHVLIKNFEKNAHASVCSKEILLYSSGSSRFALKFQGLFRMYRNYRCNFKYSSRNSANMTILWGSWDSCGSTWNAIILMLIRPKARFNLVLMN